MATLYCKKCGSALTPDAKFCTDCGTKISVEDEIGSKKIKASNHANYGTYSLISILLPGIGIILGIVYLTKDSVVDKKLGEHLIAVGVFALIIWGVIYSMLAPNLLTTPL